MPGNISASIVLTDNLLNVSGSTQTAQLSGVGAEVITPTIAWTVRTSAVVAGTPLAFTVTAENPTGSTVTGYAGTISLNTSDPAGNFRSLQE